MIVKVQLSKLGIFKSSKKRRVLIYNKNRNITYEADATPGILILMDGADKAYFEAVLTKDNEINIVEHTPVEGQNW